MELKLPQRRRYIADGGKENQICNNANTSIGISDQSDIAISYEIMLLQKRKKKHLNASQLPISNHPENSIQV